MSHFEPRRSLAEITETQSWSAVQHFVEGAQAVQAADDHNRRTELLQDMATILADWFASVVHWSCLDLWNLLRSIVAMHEEPSQYHRQMMHAFVEWNRTCPERKQEERVMDTVEESGGLCLAKHKAADSMQHDVDLLSKGLRGEVTGTAMRSCLDKHLGKDILLCRLYAAALADERPMRVSGLAVLFLGEQTPLAYTRKWFDLSACEHPIRKLSQLEEVVATQAPLPSHWEHATRFVCIEPYYYRTLSEYGDALMPQQLHSGGKQHARSSPVTRRRSRQNRVAAKQDRKTSKGQVFTDSDFSGSDSDGQDCEDDTCLEAVSSSRTMWQFACQLRNMHDGSVCIMCLQLVWSQRDCLCRLKDPQYYSSRECKGFDEFCAHLLETSAEFQDLWSEQSVQGGQSSHTTQACG